MLNFKNLGFLCYRPKTKKTKVLKNNFEKKKVDHTFFITGKFLS